MIDESNVPRHLLDARETLTKRLNSFSVQLSKYPKNSMGLTINQDAAHRKLKAEVNKAFKQLQKVNPLIVKARKRKNPAIQKWMKCKAVRIVGDKLEVMK